MKMKIEISELEKRLERTLADIQEALTTRMEHASAADMVHLSEAIKNITESWCRMEQIKIQREQIRKMMEAAGTTGQVPIVMVGGPPGSVN